MGTQAASKSASGPHSGATHVVKVYRGTYDSVLKIGTLAECQMVASAMNRQYQTDEYRVEPFDTERWKK